jgi:hypothetical protein
MSVEEGVAKWQRPVGRWDSPGPVTIGAHEQAENRRIRKEVLVGAKHPATDIDALPR